MRMSEAIKQYKNAVSALLNGISEDQVMHMIQLLLEAYHHDRQVFVAGNGGSAASANHFSCDFGKNAVQNHQRKFRVISLSTNIENVTAIGNDISFDEIFREQLRNLMRPEDVIILISASGNSPDIIKVCEYAKQMNAHIISISGFSGGDVLSYAEEAIVIPSNSYEQIEDMQMSILHMIVYTMKLNQQWFAE